MPRSKRRKGAKKAVVPTGGTIGGRQRRRYDPGTAPRPADPSKRPGANITPATRPPRRAHT